MAKTIITSDDVFFLFRDVTGGADIDDVYDEYGYFNLETPNDRKEFIKKCLVNAFSTMTNEQKSNLKSSLYYFAFHDSKTIKTEAPSYLFPFSFPDDVSMFLKEIWHTFFDDNYSLDNLDITIV